MIIERRIDMPLEGSLVENAARLLRLAHLLNMNPAGYTLKYITNYFECNNTTARNYIEALESVGFEIEELSIQDEDEGVLFRLLHIPDKFPDDIKVSCDFILPFYFLANIAPEIKNTFLEKLIHEGFNFLETLFASSTAVKASQTMKVVGDVNEYLRRAGSLFIHHSQLGKSVLTPADKAFQCIIYAILKRKLCEVIYRSVSYKETKTFIIKPLHIVRYHDTLYLLAIDITHWMKRNMSDHFNINRAIIESNICYRGLSIKRIIKAKELDDTFDNGDPYIQDLAKVLLRDLDSEHIKRELLHGRMGSLPISKDPEMTSVLLRISPNASGVIRDYQWGLNQIVKDYGEKGIELSFYAPLDEDLISWILSLGSEAKVISPPELRDRICNEALKVKDMYA
jgi:predicted DNA-binding transcriptional regulator YafY